MFKKLGNIKYAHLLRRKDNRGQSPTWTGRHTVLAISSETYEVKSVMLIMFILKPTLAIFRVTKKVGFQMNIINLADFMFAA